MCVSTVSPTQHKLAPNRLSLNNPALPCFPEGPFSMRKNKGVPALQQFIAHGETKALVGEQEKLMRGS